eukprot:TRINITY_DN115172_c0_g1_i1.p1 TRINITY_DN115172_c0_g1~~TRINITY_DN115172_c0_g1_i1.p1  ORF type:complete len:178 (-),score=25.35 TRINITY_DN115172_c0_g1_i1:136-669(-)
MGQSIGTLNSNEVKELAALTQFTPKQLQRLHRRFTALDEDGNGAIEIEEFNNVPGMKENPLLPRMVSVFDTDGDGCVDFQEFVTALASFSNDCQHEEKLRFCFRVYDIDGDGYISNPDLFGTLKMMVGDNLNGQQLQQIVDRTFLEVDKDKDGLLSFREFQEAVKHTDIGTKLTLSV